MNTERATKRRCKVLRWGARREAAMQQDGSTRPEATPTPRSAGGSSGSRAGNLPRRTGLALAGSALAAIAIWPAASAQPVTLRVGHFPNLTHVQALVAHRLTPQGKGWFAQRL